MKHALVTGASGGLGQYLCREYLNRGYKVLGCDLRQNEATQKLKTQFSENFLFLELNVASDSSVDLAAKAVLEKTKALDIVVNGAAILPPNSAKILEEFEITQSLDVFNINSLGPLRVTKAFLPLLTKGEDRLIINISSEAGSMTTHCDYTFRYDYCMSKAAVNIQSIILQRYLKPDGIKVLAVHPGWMQTQMGGSQAPVLPADSAKGIVNLGEQYLHKLDEGIYFDYDGKPRAW